MASCFLFYLAHCSKYCWPNFVFCARCMEPPSTTHAGDLMFIMEEVVEGNKWYVAYEGRPVPNAEGEQELEKRAAVFRTSASFWEDGVHEWETNNVRSRATYAEPAEEPQWRASDFMVCTRHEM